ncbi:MAG: transposase [Firmicutes bacterium HGW-Firmicutes-12]|jgi:transposase|nr:MAG: transposase [Firmicutes bacterium HGW-Firmicutes-12]
MRDYDKDFKEEAIKMSYEIGPTKTSAQLGVPVTTLYTWRGKVKKHGAIAFVGSGHPRVDPKTIEMRALEKKIKELESANDILKKALGFFAESQKK